MRQPRNASGFTRQAAGDGLPRNVVWAGLANLRDNIVVDQLVRTRPGALAVDKHALLLGKDGITRLREELIGVYTEAAARRREACPTRPQLASAKSGLEHLFKAAARFDETRPLDQRGLAGAFGGTADDRKGIQETNAFSSACGEVRQKINAVAIEVCELIEAAESAPMHRGARKKRLRSLVETLAVWWTQKLGRKIAPYVKAKRLGPGKKVFMLGRSGPFVSLAVDLLNKLDDFAESEVVSAITTVHEQHLAAKRRASVR